MPDEDQQTLLFTGERYLPGMEGNMQLEHLHRYAVAVEYVKDQVVLDIACGEGYGSAMLSGSAQRVIGVDLSEEAVRHARNTYQNDNIEFKVGSCTKIPLSDNSVDSVVSFETIEHHDRHEAMMAEIKRVLKPGGLVIISSPDKHTYSDVSDYKNPYHVKELYSKEFKDLLKTYFKKVAIYGQRIAYGSCVFPEENEGRMVTYNLNEMKLTSSVMKARSKGIKEPLYLIAVASDAALPKTIGSVLEQPVWEGELFRKAIAEKATALSESTSLLEQTKAAFKEKDSLVLTLQKTIDQKEAVLAEKKQHLSDVKSMIREKEKVIAAQKKTLAEKEKALKNASAVIDEKEQAFADALAEKERVIIAKDEMIAEKERALKNANAVIDEKEQAFADTLAEKERVIIAKDEMIAEKKKALKNASALIDEKERAIIAKDGMIAEKEKALEDAGAVIGKKERELAAVAASLSEREQDSKKAYADLQSVQLTLSEKERQVEGCREELYSVYMSRSWRYTLMPRKAGTLVRRLTKIPHKPLIRAKIKQVYFLLPASIRHSQWIDKMKNRFKDKELRDILKR